MESVRYAKAEQVKDNLIYVGDDDDDSMLFVWDGDVWNTVTSNGI